MVRILLKLISILIDTTLHKWGGKSESYMNPGRNNSLKFLWLDSLQFTNFKIC